MLSIASRSPVDGIGLANPVTVPLVEPGINRKALAGEVIEYPPWRLKSS